MYSKAKIAGHPIHPMLVGFPIAFYTATVMSYVYYVASTPNNPFWFEVGYIANIAGVVSALLASIPGFIDWAFGVPKDTAAKKTGLKHLVLNLSALVLFAASAWSASSQLYLAAPEAGLPIVLSIMGLGLTVVGGYLGWKMIGTHHVGVDITPAQARYEPLETVVPSSREYPGVQPLRRDTPKENKPLSKTGL